MQIDHRIPMMGQQPDFVGSIARGAQAGQFVNDARHQNALRGALQEHGAGLVAGDTGARNALAGFDPQMVMQADAHRQGMQHNEQTMQIAYQQAGMKAQEFAANISAQERAQLWAELGTGANMMEVADTPEAFAQVAQAPGVAEAVEAFLGPNMLTFENRALIVAAANGAAAALAVTGGGEGNLQARASDILADGTIIQSTDRGPRVFAPTGEELTGQAAADAIRMAQDFNVQNQREINQGRREGTLSGDVNLGSAAASATRSGTIAADLGQEAFQNYRTAVGAASTIDEAIAAIDAGGRSGLAERFLPNITLASAALENAMNRMGLDVIASVTFGALSEGEMRLAMDVAAPRDLAPAQLREWLVSKRDAQLKAADALLEAGRYLSTPGNTLQTWTEEQQRRRGGGNGTPQQGQTAPAGNRFDSMALPDLLSFDVMTLDGPELDAFERRLQELGQ